MDKKIWLNGCQKTERHKIEKRNKITRKIKEIKDKKRNIIIIYIEKQTILIYILN